MNLQIDPALTKVAVKKIPKSWGARAVFYSPAAQEIWLTRISDEKSPEVLPDLLTMYQEILKQALPFDNFISIGAGGGETDKRILQAVIGENENTIKYIPVDIANTLLVSSYREIEKSYQSPVQILCDLETSQVLNKTIRSYCKGRKIVSVLGNTIGNCDLGEENFVKRSVRLLANGDCLFLSFSVGEIIQSKNSMDQLASLESLKDLIAGGLAFKYKRDFGEVRNQLDSDLFFKYRQDKRMGSFEVGVYDAVSRERILPIRRYDFKKFSNWIVRKFPLKLIQSGLVKVPRASLRVGVLLLEKRK